MSLFLTNRFFVVAFSLVALFCTGYVFDAAFTLARVLLVVWVVLTIVDVALLYCVRGSKMKAERECSSRFSNGDPNRVEISCVSPYAFKTWVEVIDEMPIQFQMRDAAFRGTMKANETSTFGYELRPTTRGVYQFDRIRIFFSTCLGLVQRRFTRGTSFDVKVYPSFAHLSLYALICNHRLDEYGIKRVRQVGSDTDFEQIKDYVQGDEYRHINWKASARTHSLKVNVYQQDRSMPVYCIIDKGRMQQQTTYGLTFLEYSINAALALAYVAIKKDDQVGLTAFSTTVDAHVPASKHGAQMQLLMEALYAQQTMFGESDYSALSVHFTQKVTKRSLVMLFSNISTLNALRREMPCLRQIARRHQLVVVLFRDREMEDFLNRQPSDTEEYYQQYSVRQYNTEKIRIIKELRRNNILTVYSFPEELSVATINRYLEIRRF